jgi:hypothetical protein
MAEISLPKQLSGPEALESLLAHLRNILRTHSRFAPHMAYAGYRAEIGVKFYPAASFIPPFEMTLDVDKVPEGSILSETATVEEDVAIPVRPPNQVREDAGLPTPVLTQDANGNAVERWVHRAKQPPKNVIKGVGREPAVTMVPTVIPVEKNERP